MTRQISKLVFVLALWVMVLPFKGQSVGAYVDNQCTCESDYVYLYSSYKPYTDWYYFIDQSEPYYNSSTYPPGLPAEAYGLFCKADCEYYGKLEAGDLCSRYNLPDQHYQYAGMWHWEDSNNDSGGTKSGFYDRGNGTNSDPHILLCATWPN